MNPFSVELISILHSRWDIETALGSATKHQRYSKHKSTHVEGPVSTEFSTFQGNQESKRRRRASMLERHWSQPASRSVPPNSGLHLPYFSRVSSMRKVRTYRVVPELSSHRRIATHSHTHQWEALVRCPSLFYVHARNFCWCTPQYELALADASRSLGSVYRKCEVGHGGFWELGSRSQLPGKMSRHCRTSSTVQNSACEPVSVLLPRNFSTIALTNQCWENVH